MIDENGTAGHDAFLTRRIRGKHIVSLRATHEGGDGGSGCLGNRGDAGKKSEFRVSPPGDNVREGAFGENVAEWKL